MALKKPRERGAFFIFCPNTHELSCERLTPLAYNTQIIPISLKAHKQGKGVFTNY